MCRLSWNPGTSTSWNPLGLSRPVMGLLYIFYPAHFNFFKTVCASQLNGYQLDGQTSILCRGNFFFFASVVSYSGVHPASRGLTTGVSLRGEERIGSWRWLPPSYYIRSKSFWYLPPLHHICDHRSYTVLRTQHKSFIFVVIHPLDTADLLPNFYFCRPRFLIIQTIMCSNARFERSGNDACSLPSLRGVHFGTSGSQTIIIWLQSSRITLLRVSSELL